MVFCFHQALKPSACPRLEHHQLGTRTDGAQVHPFGPGSRTLKIPLCFQVSESSGAVNLTKLQKQHPAVGKKAPVTVKTSVKRLV